MKAKKDIRQDLANKFINAISEKPLEWHKSFISPHGNPRNGITGKRFSFINSFILSSVMADKGYRDDRFYSQSYIFGSKENREKDFDDKTKIKVKKGEKPVPIESYFFVPKSNLKEEEKEGLKAISIVEYYKLEQDDKIKYRPQKRTALVYNGEQLTGIKEYKLEERTDLQLSNEEIFKAVDNAVKAMKVHVIEQDGFGRAYYIPEDDTICLPSPKDFISEYEYYATKLHELGHSTGHETRLNRDLSGKFGSEKYAIEELNVEIASCFLANEFGLSMTENEMDNHKAYIQSWIKNIKENKKVLISAIFEAERIADYIEDMIYCRELDLSVETKNMQEDECVL